MAHKPTGRHRAPRPTDRGSPSDRPRAPAASPFLDALPIYPRRWRAARKTVMPVAPTNARVPMRPRVSRADAPSVRVRRASAKTLNPKPGDGTREIDPRSETQNQD